jgi:hypothetical protein
MKGRWNPMLIRRTGRKRMSPKRHERIESQSMSTHSQKMFLAWIAGAMSGLRAKVQEPQLLVLGSQSVSGSPDICRFILDFPLPTARSTFGGQDQLWCFRSQLNK